MTNSKTVPPILNDDHLTVLNQALEAEAIQQQHLYNCVQCGLPVDKLKADSDRRLALATALKKIHFPNAN